MNRARSRRTLGPSVARWTAGRSVGALRSRCRRVPVRWATAVAGAAFLGFGIGTGYTFSTFASGVEPENLPPTTADRAAERAGLDREARSLQARAAARRPRGNYIVVDRGENRLYLRRGDQIRLDAVVSTGSGAILRETTGERRTWQFDTPTGRLSVLEERYDPVWVKPDWAFLEEGRLPPSISRERREYGVLGEFALSLGDGYLIHGTLYERLLGRSVTHGCVRVGRDALRALVRGSGVGTPVFIF